MEIKEESYEAEGPGAVEKRGARGFAVDFDI